MTRTFLLPIRVRVPQRQLDQPLEWPFQSLKGWEFHAKGCKFSRLPRNPSQCARLISRGFKKQRHGIREAELS